ncbi:hypothetical protein [Nonomuraea longicatena]|uniref:Integral membrane protein n=1 Tax=Nonomuraea longicatena TaxID=83682 RepID=A0ABN1NPN0_9ACTN
MAPRQHLEALSRSARSLRDLVGELSSALAEDDDEGAAYARDGLTRLARDTLGEDRLGFEPADAPGPADPGFLLASVARDLALSGALLSAEAGDPGRLHEAESALDRLEGALTAPGRLGFEGSGGRSPDLPSAITALRLECAGCLDHIAERTAGVAAAALTEIPFVGRLAEHVKRLGDDLGLGAAAGTLARLAVRVLERALTALRGLVTAPLLERAGRAVAGYADGLEQNKGAGALLMAGVLGVERTKRDLTARLAADGLDSARLDRATAELTELSDGFGRRMDLIALAVSLGAAVAAWLASPLAAGAVAALLLAAAVVTAADHADTWRRPVLVRGVRAVVEEATTP